MNLYKSFFKRVIDIMVSGLALLVLAVPLAAVSVWLHFANKGAGVFFLQERPGKDGTIFKVIKFKTMTDERDANGDLLPNKDRLTPIGRFIRAASIDELPQFINVFKGDMSLIGPRPLLTWFLPLYSPEQARRHEVRPGITGWAQVHGRNMTSYSEKFVYDVWYVDNVSFKTDVQIVYMTIKNVLSAKDIGNGNQDEVDDLGWNQKKMWAEQEFELKFRNKYEK